MKITDEIPQMTIFILSMEITRPLNGKYTKHPFTDNIK